MKLFLSQIKDIENIPAYLKDLEEMNIKDNNIYLNVVTHSATNSLGSGISIKSGDGVNDVTFHIINTQSLTNIDTSEYTGATGPENRSWATELKDIVLDYDELNNEGTRVLTERGGVVKGDLDLGTYSISAGNISEGSSGATGPTGPNGSVECISNTSVIAELEYTNNWSSAAYVGPTISNTEQGNTHYDSSYLFIAVGNNQWIRVARV